MVQTLAEPLEKRLRLEPTVCRQNRDIKNTPF